MSHRGETDRSELENALPSYNYAAASMHAAIQHDDLTGMRQLLQKHPNIRYFYLRASDRDDGCSAAAFALECRNLEAYKLLAENGAAFVTQEFIADKFNDAFGERISNLNASLCHQLPDRHISALLAKSELPSTDPDAGMRSELIRQVLEELATVAEVVESMRVLAAVPELKIIFDFTQPYVKYMDPTVRLGTDGLYDVENCRILVAALELLDPRKAHHMRAVIAHEFHHCALQFVFRNKRLPHAIGDGELYEGVFLRCMEICRNKKSAGCDPIVSDVFKYYSSREAQKRELAVRVAQMHAFYASQSSSTEFNDARALFRELFEFHTSRVVPAMQAAVPVLKDLANRSFVIQYEQLTAPLKAAIRHAKVSFQGEHLKLSEVAGPSDEASKVLTELDNENIRNLLEDKLLFIGTSPKADNNFYFAREFAKNSSLARDFGEILSEVNNTRLFLLSDLAGAGKSTTMRQLSVKLKKQAPNTWTSYVDLKMHLHVYETHAARLQSEQLSDNDAKSLIRMALMSILAVNGHLDIITYEQCFDDGRLVLLLDGVDEISPKFTDFFLRFISRMHRLTQCRLWVATRPQNFAKIEEFLECEAHHLLELSEPKVNEFLKGLLKKKGLHEQEPLNEIQRVRKALNDVNYPLILRLLVDLQVAGKLAMSNVNLFSIFKSVLELKEDILSAKGKIVSRNRENNQARMTVWEVHQVYAVKVLLGDVEIENVLEPSASDVDFRSFSLFRRWRREKRNWTAETAETVSRPGILNAQHWNSSGEEFLAFVHRSFAEFFAAQFIIESTEEALEADDDDMSDGEFEKRMIFAAYFVRDRCSNSPNFDIITDFVNHYILAKDLHELKFGARFQAFLTGNKLRLAVERMLNEPACVRTFILSNVLRGLVEMSDHDESIVCKLLDGYRHGESLVPFFRRFLATIKPDDDNKAFNYWTSFNGCISTLKLFNSLCSSSLADWHRFTGFNVHLDQAQVQAILSRPIDLKNIEDDYEFWPHTSNSNENKQLELFYTKTAHQLFSFFIADAGANSELVDFSRAFVTSCVALAIKSRTLTDKLLEFIEKRLDKHHQVLIFSELIFSYCETGAEDMTRCQLIPKVFENLRHIFEKVERILGADRDKVRQIFVGRPRKKTTEIMTSDVFCSLGCLLIYSSVSQDCSFPFSFLSQFFATQEILEFFAEALQLWKDQKRFLVRNGIDDEDVNVRPAVYRVHFNHPGRLQDCLSSFTKFLEMIK